MHSAAEGSYSFRPAWSNLFIPAGGERGSIRKSQDGFPIRMSGMTMARSWTFVNCSILLTFHSSRLRFTGFVN